MSARIVFTVGGGSLSTYAAIALGIRQGVALFGDAQAAGDILALVQGWPVNWDAVYLLMVIVGLFTVIAAQFPKIQAWRRDRAREKRRYWDTAANEAINYIADGTYFSAANPKNKRVDIAINAFIEAAMQGRLMVAGRTPHSGTLQDIDKRIWRKASPRYKVGRRNYGQDYEVESFTLETDAENGATWFEGLMVDRKQVERLWPRRPGGRI
ncbi:MAG: hypothetical protein WEA84_14675 [Rhodovibrionaceae bacterium]